MELHAVFGVATPAVLYVNDTLAYAFLLLSHATLRLLFLLIFTAFRIRGGLLMACQIAILIISGYFLF
jgi:hypothetical protein